MAGALLADLRLVDLLDGAEEAVAGVVDNDVDTAEVLVCTFFADWNTIAAQAVAGLRQEAGTAVGDAELAALIDELSIDPDFRALWARHDVRAVRGDAKRLVHPTAGAMTVSRQVLSLPDSDGQALLAYYAEPGTASAAALASLL